MRDSISLTPFSRTCFVASRLNIITQFMGVDCVYVEFEEFIDYLKFIEVTIV